MTNPPFWTEVQRLRQWCGDPTQIERRAAIARVGEVGEHAPARHHEVDIETVVTQLEPIRSRSSLLASFAREASPTEPVRAAYAIRWIELGSGIAMAGVSRSRRRRVMRPVLRARA